MKTVIISALAMFLFMGCEKIEFFSGKITGTYSSETFKLADIDSTKVNLKVEADVIKKVFLSNANDLIFKVDSISNNTMIYFNFQSSSKQNYYGKLEIEKTDSEMYRLIGYLNINDPFTFYDRWRYILYFN